MYIFDLMGKIKENRSMLEGCNRVILFRDGLNSFISVNPGPQAQGRPWLMHEIL